jgi:C1A family cysteine protease
LGDEDTTRNLQVITVPSSVDWTSVITPVKDQGNCGSCWAFATIAAIEAMYKKVKQVTYSFSEQELTDCVYGNSVNGCDGGWPTKAFRYVKNKQILTEASYPYTGKDQNCKKVRKT